MQLSKALEGYKIGFMAEGYSQLTLKTYLSALNKLIEYLGDKEIKDVTSEDLHKFMNYLVTDYVPKRSNRNKNRLSSASHHRYWKAIRSFFKWANEEIGIERPDMTLKMPRWENKEIIPLTEEEIRILLKGCEFATVNTVNRKPYRIKRPLANRNKAIILVLLDTGIRVGELTRLRVSDINLENGEVHIQQHHVRKSHSRTTYLGKKARKVIWQYLADREDIQQDDLLFLTDSSKPMTCQRIYSLLSRLGRSCGIRKVYPQKFRHTFAIQYLRNGGDIFTLKRILGHKRFDMVNHYLNISLTDAYNAHQKASPVDRWDI